MYYSYYFVEILAEQKTNDLIAEAEHAAIVKEAKLPRKETDQKPEGLQSKRFKLGFKIISLFK